jgi:opacity protein-like surface antigen
MMRLFATALLVLGSVCAVQAQESAPAEKNDKANMVLEYAAASASRPASVHFLTASDMFFLPPARPMNTFEAPVVPTVLTEPLDAADPAAPSPKPKFLYSRSDIDRWELGLGFNWIRFRSSIFNASAVGLKTSVSYFTNNWFAIEGNVSAAFAPEIFDREHVKLLIYGAGPKIAWRQNERWEPWVHAILGGAHEQPQTAGNSRNTYSIQLGGGADYHFNPRFSGRLEGNYVRTSFFSQSQNNFQLCAGIVMHF